MIRRIGRALAITAMVLAIPVSVAAGLTAVLLDDSTWTDPNPVEPTAAPRPAPAPEPSTRAKPTPTAWDLGDCYTPQLAPADCGQTGALRIVGVVQEPGERPCAGLPETTLVRRTGPYALCLTTAG